MGVYKYPHMFQPMTIGNLTFKNRVGHLRGLPRCDDPVICSLLGVLRHT